MSGPRFARLLALAAMLGLGAYALYLATALLVRHDAPARADDAAELLTGALYWLATALGVAAFWVAFALGLAARHSGLRPIDPVPPWPRLPLLALCGPAVSFVYFYTIADGMGPQGSWAAPQWQLFIAACAWLVVLPALAPLAALWLLRRARP